MSFRIEEKIICTYQESEKLRSALFQQGMNELYPSRVVNSVYFDTRDHEMYFDSEEGTLPRRKVRLRHYENTDSKFNLETKISSIEGRFKTARSVAKPEATNLLTKGITVNSYGSCLPQIVVRYEREYYELDNIRITFDSNIQYRKHRSKVIIKDPLTVTEIKAPINAPKDFLEKLIGERRRR